MPADISVLEWSVIKEKIKLRIVQSGELYVTSKLMPAKHTKPLSSKTAAEQHCE